MYHYRIYFTIGCACEAQSPGIVDHTAREKCFDIEVYMRNIAFLTESLSTPNLLQSTTRTRITSVKNTKKITTAMRLVAAAKVRRAQDAVIKNRPFSEMIQGLIGGLVGQMGMEDINLPLLTQREVKNVMIVGVSGDRGLCGAYNSYVIKTTEARVKELTAQGYNVELLTIGKKISQYFRRRDDRYKVVRSYECGQAPSASDATSVAKELLDAYLSFETDSVEVIYTRFVSLISSEPSIRTLLPMSIRGIEDTRDEIFQLTSTDGSFGVDRKELPKVEPTEISQETILEQDPVQILNSLLPLYLNGQVLRMLQESIAAELAARMASMAAASDNAAELSKKLSLLYNRARQASVTQELLEIVAGADAANSGGKR